MSATAQHLLGQLADGRFALRKLLGVSPNSAVFLTSSEAARPGDSASDAAIKLIPEDPSNSDVQLDRWRATAALSHPGLLRILHFGRCTIDGAPCLYVVTELADEDLGQLLPRRALTPDETRGMLAAVLPALDFLHENGLVHAGLKPSNIHATGDNVKLSADRILPAGESSSAWPLAAPFAAPESRISPRANLPDSSRCPIFPRLLRKSFAPPWSKMPRSASRSIKCAHCSIRSSSQNAKPLSLQFQPQTLQAPQQTKRRTLRSG